MLKDGTMCASPERCRAKLAACSTLLAACDRAAATELLTLPEPAEPMDRRGPARMKLRGRVYAHVNYAASTAAQTSAHMMRDIDGSVLWCRKKT